MIVEDGTFNNTLNLCVTRLLTHNYFFRKKFEILKDKHIRPYTHTFKKNWCDRFNFRKYPTQTNMLSIVFALLDACQRRKDPQEICKPILKYYHRLPLFSEIITTSLWKENLLLLESGTWWRFLNILYIVCLLRQGVFKYLYEQINANIYLKSSRNAVKISWVNNELKTKLKND